MVGEKTKYVSYFRVSTQRQGRSGLGLEAQQQAVADFTAGGGWRCVGSFKEVESGKDNSRPELAKALAECRVHKAVLIVAKLDRLSRDAAFLLNLQAAGVGFRAVDMPTANEMIVGIMAVVAQAERKMISERTRAALAAAKRRGKRLGTPKNFTAAGRRKGSRIGCAIRLARANQRAKDLLPKIEDAKTAIGTNATLRAIADVLNKQNIPTPRRTGRWHSMTVQRIVERVGQT